MKKTILIFISTLCLNAQQKNTLETKNLVVTWDNNINPNKIWITLSQSNQEDISFYNLYQDGKFNNGDLLIFPKKSGYYYLSINYDMKQHYREIVYYKQDPINEKLSFNLFRKKGKLYCKMYSSQYDNLTKTVELYNINYEKIKENLKEIKKKKP